MTFARAHWDDALIVVGLTTIVAGCALFSVPLGLIVGGVALTAAGLLLGGE
ncbi:MAG: hypothetical protein NUW01_15945 [Gemmatimonadaceae bacterium]|nr:hypothetical protein [Gemmatimonadaceae bacterium]